MCGIAGIFGCCPSDLREITAMIAALAHRGPDGRAVWINQEAAIALGHSRLSIMDLSSAGQQPMQSANGRLVLIFNGEIYNFAEIRNALERHGLAPKGGWRSHCDSEVLLEAIAGWGLEKALARATGMFAFALWDQTERRLTLVRDRFGEKPLYYGWAGKAFLFASELKALRAYSHFTNAISREAVAQVVSRSYIPAPSSIFERIYKLPPGCVLELDLLGATHPRDCAPSIGVKKGGLSLSAYWSYREEVETGIGEPIVGEQQALDELDRALSASVQRQSIADVPVGAFLSGGIDSSLIVALKQNQSPSPLRTYSIGFGEPAYNEAHHARATAAFLGTIHHEEYVTAERSRDVIEALPAIFDEPFADASQVPTHILSRLAAKDVKVVLTGDGGDELFAGYYHHFLAPRIWRRLQLLPQPFRQAMLFALGRVSPNVWKQAAAMVAKRKQAHIGFKIQKALRAAARSNSIEDVHCALMEEWELDSSPVLNVSPSKFEYPYRLERDASDTDRILFGDAVTYLPDDILCKVDRAAMAASLETRAPFLDHGVAQIAARIPVSMKVKSGRGKVILRNLIRRYLPEQLVERPKNGFAAPVGEWLKGTLRPWAEDLLDPSRMRQEGWFDEAVVTARWSDHLNGKKDSTGALWSVLMFNAWLRTSPRSDQSRQFEPAVSPLRLASAHTRPNLDVPEQCVA